MDTSAVDKMSYLRTYSLGELVRSSFTIYFRNWSTLFAIYAIPVVPVLLIKAALSSGKADAVGITFGVLTFLASMMATFPCTVAVSEICLGIRPNTFRSYRRAFANSDRLVGTYLLFFLVIIVGYILLIVPGIVFSVWYIFIGPVVVLETFGGYAAFRRSRELGRGYFLRNIGILTIMLLLIYLLILAISLTILVPVMLLGFNHLGVTRFIGELGGLVASPPYLAAVVLLYYDMRVRKEGYGAAQLAEDLRF